jgi:hypothetical protein
MDYKITKLIAIIGLTVLCTTVSAEVEVGVGNEIPWSGDWWPLRGSPLATGYREGDSPLTKYDKFIYGDSLKATNWELTENHGVANPPHWRGHCQA